MDVAALPPSFRKLSLGFDRKVSIPNAGGMGMSAARRLNPILTSGGEVKAGLSGFHQAEPVAVAQDGYYGVDAVEYGVEHQPFVELHRDGNEVYYEP